MENTSIHIGISSDGRAAERDLARVAQKERAIADAAKETNKQFQTQAELEERATKAGMSARQQRQAAAAAERAELERRAAYQRQFIAATQGPEHSRSSLVAPARPHLQRPPITAAVVPAPMGRGAYGASGQALAREHAVSRNVQELERLRPLERLQEQEAALYRSQMGIMAGAELASIKSRVEQANVAKAAKDAQAAAYTGWWGSQLAQQELDATMVGPTGKTLQRRQARERELLARDIREVAFEEKRIQQTKLAKVEALNEELRLMEVQKSFRDQEVISRDAAEKRMWQMRAATRANVEEIGKLKRANTDMFHGFGREALRHIGVMGLMVAGYTAVSKTIESVGERAQKRSAFEDVMTPLLSMDNNMDKIKETKKEVLELSTAWRTSADEVAQMQYNIQSNASALPKDVTKAIERETLLLKEATGTPLDIGAMLGAKTYLSFPDTFASVEEMYTKLQKTADLGGMDTPELARYAPDVFAAGEALGRSFDEIAASLVVATQHMGSAEKAFTGVRTLFARMIQAKKHGLNLTGPFQEQLMKIATQNPERMVDVFMQEGVTTAGALGRNWEEVVAAQQQINAARGNRRKELISKRMAGDAAYRAKVYRDIADTSLENAPNVDKPGKLSSEMLELYKYSRRGYEEIVPDALDWASPVAGMIEAGLYGLRQSLKGHEFSKFMRRISPRFLHPMTAFPHMVETGASAVSGWMDRPRLYEFGQMRAWRETVGSNPDLAHSILLPFAERDAFWKKKQEEAEAKEPVAEQPLVEAVRTSFDSIDQAAGKFVQGADSITDAGDKIMRGADMIAQAVSEGRVKAFGAGDVIGPNRKRVDSITKRDERRALGEKYQASYASGAEYVPEDQNVRVHRGEMIVPADEAQEWGEATDYGGEEDYYSGEEDVYEEQRGGRSNADLWGRSGGGRSNADLWGSRGGGTALTTLDALAEPGPAVRPVQTTPVQLTPVQLNPVHSKPLWGGGFGLPNIWDQPGMGNIFGGGRGGGGGGMTVIGGNNQSLAGNANFDAWNGGVDRFGEFVMRLEAVASKMESASDKQGARGGGQAPAMAPVGDWRRE